MQQYLDLLTHVMENGTDRSDRTGTRSKRIFSVSHSVLVSSPI